MYKKNKKYTKSKKLNVKLLIIALVVLVLGALGYWQFVYKDNQANSTNTEANSDQPSADDTEKIDYSPATEEEQKSADDIKDTPKSSTTKPSQPNTSSTKTAVTPTITSANASPISGYVTGVFEEGGTCTATFTKGTTTKTRSSTGFQNVNYTQCAPITIPSGFLSAGSWKLTLKYSSNTASGTSVAQTLEI